MAAHSHVLAELPSDVIVAGGTRSFTGAVKGVTPVAPEDLTTKGYVDGLPGLNGDAVTIQGEDVDSTPPEDGDVLVYDGGEAQWEPRSLADLGAATRNGVRALPLGTFYAGPIGAGPPVEVTLALDATSVAFGDQRLLQAARTTGAVRRVLAQCEFHVPEDYVPGTSLRVRVRAILGRIALVSNTLDVQVRPSDGKEQATASDVVTTAAMALRPYTVGEAIVGSASVSSTPWRDYEFALDGANLGAGEPCTLVVQFDYNDTAGIGLDGNIAVGQVLLMVGMTGWYVGRNSIVGSALLS